MNGVDAVHKTANARMITPAALRSFLRRNNQKATSKSNNARLSGIRKMGRIFER